MIKVVLLGLGNLGVPLAKALLGSNDIDLVQIYSRSHVESFFEGTVPVTREIENLFSADIYLMTIKDDVISKFSSELSHLEGLIVHTSGAMSIDAIGPSRHKGVLYPVQTFRKELDIDFKKVPIACEVDDEGDDRLLHKLAHSLSDKVFRLSSDQRLQLHISCVFANNFTNHMYQIASEICNENGISFELIKPLILETSDKILSNLPEDVQTGPAIRNDFLTLQKHMEKLNANRQEIYKLVSDSIQNSKQ